MRKSKFLSVAVSSAMVASMMLTGCGNTGNGGGNNVNENGEFELTSLKVLVDGTVNSVKQETEDQRTVRDAFIPQLEEAIGEAIGHEIDIEFEVGDHTGYNDYVGRKFVGQQYPDVMIMSANMMKQYASSGLLWDMADAYANAEFQSRLTLPGVNEGMKDSQGHLYGFAPTYGNGCVTYIKQSWLDNVGINGDDIKTYDDFYNMLLAFKNGDPDGNGVNGDTYGFISAGLIGTEAPWINYTAEFWQDAYPSIIQGEDGVWYDGFQTDATKAALERLKQAYYVDKVIDPDSFTAGTKQAREKWWGAEQSGSAGVFTYWAGTWYKNVITNLEKNNNPSEVYELAPIAEIQNSYGGYLNREAPVWVIIDDGDGDDTREQAIFDAFLATMLDGDRVQSLWTYGAEGIEWSTQAEEFSTNVGKDNQKDYSYAEGEFHQRPSLADENVISTKNHLDPLLVISPLANGFVSINDYEAISNKFFTDNCVDAPVSPSSDTYSERSADIVDARAVAISSVVVSGGDVDAAMETYKASVGSLIDQILAELNAAE
ncbi:MAG: ABC transporter substrate-binding protein [Roseburia sp.]|nr:ABC transporter substrate-binding protein [Roseburia sp.]MCM1098808.1 ABC transporter substrate-binding protein [Ruminococcus flavefaciens]